MPTPRPGAGPAVPTADAFEALDDALGPDYEIIRELGRGGVSIVYLARDRELGREVAIKVIREQYVEDEEALARFAREARTVARLQHPNIVSVHGARRLGAQRLALIMQHVTGPTLRQVIRETGPLHFATVEQVLCDIARALSHAHRFHVVHRDIKPENIYLDREAPRALLSDFGIAKPLDVDSAVTMHGVVLGTPAYMAPEQVDGGRVDARSDVYSLGLVGYEMLTGRRPWEGESIYNVLYKQKHEELPPLAEARADVPATLRAVIERALQKDPALRWQGMDELLVGLLGERAARSLDGVPALPPAAKVPVPGIASDVHTIRFRKGTTPEVAAIVPQPAAHTAAEAAPAAEPVLEPLPAAPPVVVVGRNAAPPDTSEADVRKVLAEADAAAVRDGSRARPAGGPPLRYAAALLAVLLVGGIAYTQLPRSRAADPGPVAPGPAAIALAVPVPAAPEPADAGAAERPAPVPAGDAAVEPEPAPSVPVPSPARTPSAAA
jgi:tRNA A-37 threonylcarbamoyl transferase component Bud32